MAYQMLVLSVLLVVIVHTTYGKNRKYPFYRPNYASTRPIFEPFAKALSLDVDDQNRNTQLFQFIATNANQFESYHNYTEYLEEIEFLTQLANSKASPFASILAIQQESKSVDGHALHRLIITDTSIPSDNKQKILMIFGEHPREFIVSESMIDLVSNILLAYLADTAIWTRAYIVRVLQTFELHILPMLNPDGKLALENTGDYCWRWNTQSHRVDLNRNFAWQFAGKQGSTHRKGTEEWHGEAAFSEPEAKLVHDLLQQNDFAVVLDIHSGTQQIFVPFVDTQSRRMKRTRPQTQEELRLVEFIQNQSNGWYSDSGIAWKFNDYGADGTILDYVGGVADVDYSLCVEIYGDPTVDNSIDCFVQFNPNNGEHFVQTMNSIRTLYTGTFDYFLSPENMLAANMMDTAKQLQQYLLDKLSKV